MTFVQPPVNSQAIGFSYWTDDATSKGMFDFSFIQPPGTRISGSGDYFNQYNGSGPLQQVWPIADVEYCFHSLSVFQLQLTSDDTNSNDLLYRQNVGTPYWRAAWPTGQGIVYLDIFNQVDPRITILELTAATTNVNPAIEPNPISYPLDLSTYDFSKCVVFEFGDYYLVFAATLNNGVSVGYNDICFLYNTISGFWDVLDYGATCCSIYMGGLLAGRILFQACCLRFLSCVRSSKGILRWMAALMKRQPKRSSVKGPMSWLQGLIYLRQRI